MNKVEIDLTGAKILVVDDVPANLDVLCQSLEDTGYNVLVASDGTTALEVADFAEPDLILLDVMMPGIDGYETCRRLKSADKRTLKSFALQAAVAISDAQVRQDPSAWEDQLDEVLELEREMTDVEQFEDIARELDEEEPKA
jgi:CheY-like chemotaxis protein